MKEKTGAIINKVIKKEAREEALKVMAMAEKKDLDDFFTHYEKQSFNVVCMVIDKVKTDLVKSNKLTQNPDDHFGNFPYD